MLHPGLSTTQLKLYQTIYKQNSIFTQLLNYDLINFFPIP